MLLLDTHTFIWLCMNPELLSEKVRRMMDHDRHGLFISSITAVEIGLLVRAGRVVVPTDAEQFLKDNLRRFGIHEIPVDVEIGLASTQLPEIHRDPFDRILIATAQKHKMTILTKDQIIPTYPKVKTVWE